jgi:hypothetical protein
MEIQTNWFQVGNIASVNCNVEIQYLKLFSMSRK